MITIDVCNLHIILIQCTALNEIQSTGMISLKVTVLFAFTILRNKHHEVVITS